MRRLWWILASVIFLAACGKVMSRIDHTLAQRVGRKPTKDCSTALTIVNQNFYGMLGYRGAITQFLADNHCSILVTVDDHSHALGLVKKHKDLTKLDSYIWVENSLINVWFDETSKYPDDLSPSRSDCEQAVAAFRQVFPAATVNVATIRDTLNPKFVCYVNAEFPDDTSYEAFLGTATEGDLFHVRIARANSKLIASVMVRAISKLQNSN